MIHENLDFERLTSVQRDLAEYFARHAERIPSLSIDEIAAETGTSAATVSRFVRAAGYATLKALKGDLRDGNDRSPRGKLEGKIECIGESGEFAGLVELEMEHLRSTVALVETDAFRRAAEALAQSKVVCLYGNGSASCLVRLLGFRLNRYGKHVHELGRDASSMAETLLHLGPTTTLLAFAFVKDRPDLERALQLARESCSVTIVVTDLRVSRTAEKADIILTIDRGGPAEFHSMVAPVALVDALTIAVARAQPGALNEHLQRLSEIKEQIRGE